MQMNICVFGDSIVWGAEDHLNGGWVNILHQDLSGEDHTVYNCGICGDTTVDLLNRFGPEARARYAHAVIFAIGIDDLVYCNNENNVAVSLDRFRSNLDLLVTMANQIKTDVAFLTILSVDESKTMPYDDIQQLYFSNKNVAAYNQVIVDICGKFDIPCLNMAHVLKKEDLFDGLHPDDEGHRKIAQFVLNEMSDYLEEDDG